MGRYSWSCKTNLLSSLIQKPDGEAGGRFLWSNRAVAAEAELVPTELVAVTVHV